MDIKTRIGQQVYCIADSISSMLEIEEKKMKAQYEAGIITQEEYEAFNQEILETRLSLKEQLEHTRKNLERN